MHYRRQEKLEQEERNTRISLQKLNAQWRVILRQAKAAELRKEIEILKQTFDRVLDRKEDLAKAYVLDLTESEQQEQLAARSHMQQIDRLVDFQQELSAQLHAEFTQELDAIREEFLTERDTILAQHEKELNDLRDILFVMQTFYGDENTEASTEFNSKRDDLRTKNLECESYCLAFFVLACPLYMAPQSFQTLVCFLPVLLDPLHPCAHGLELDAP